MEQNQDVVTCKIAMLIKKFGIRTMTIDEISKRVGVSKAKLHSFFGSKEDLLSECLDFVNNELQTKIKLVLSNSDNAVKKLREIYQITFDHLSEFHIMFYFDLRKNAILKSKIQEYNKSYRSAIVFPLIEEAKKENLLVSGTDVNEAADFYMKFIYYFLLNYKNDKLAANDYIDSFFNKYVSRDFPDFENFT